MTKENWDDAKARETNNEKNIFLYPGIKEKLKLQAEWKLRQLSSDDWRAVFGRAKGFDADPLLGQMTAMDLGLKPNG